jgi:hypothetical protein
VEDIREYLVTECIEEYEDGALDRFSLERRLMGILGPDRAARLLEDVPALPVRARPQPSARAPIMGGAGLAISDVRVPLEGATLLGYLARPDETPAAGHPCHSRESGARRAHQGLRATPGLERLRGLGA